MIEAVSTSVYPSQDGNTNTSNGSNHQHTSSSNGCGSKSSLNKCVSNIIHKGFQKRKSSIEDAHVNFSRRDHQTTNTPHVHHREQHHPYMDSSYSIHSAHKKSSQEMAQPASASKGVPSSNAGPAVAVDQPSSSAHETINEQSDHANKNSLMSRILKKRRNTVFFPSNIAKLEEMTQQQPESPTGLSHYSRRLSVDHATMGNIWGRIMFNEEKQVLFLNFENLKIESHKHLENIASCIQLLITKSMDKKKKGNNMEGTIKCFLNDDDLDCDAHLFEIYTQTVHMNPLFDSVTRYTNKSLLSDHQRKIQKSLKDCEVYVKTCPCILDRFVFMVDDMIGKGTYGTVSLAMDLSLGRKVAVKRLCKKTVRLIGIEEYVKNEMEIMKILKENPHPNIVQVLDLHESEYEYLFVMEHLAGGCLDNPYDECEAFAENQVQSYFCQLVDAICHLHTNLRVLHRDIQASNCCFLDAEKKTVKLVDFGLSCLSDFSKKEHTLFCGNSNYACPELLLKKAYGPEIDVYALGVLLYKMLFGCLPFRGAQQKLMMQFTVPLDGSSEDSMFMDDGVKISKPCQELIEKILEVNGEKRFSLQDIKNHEWYRNGKDQMETSNK